ncbi:MAG: exodeoxyribonuclease VII small subunit [Firmicutes bacterium]|nr:exodeoxyribonuclease VII small subunit [Bacillota bacterium]
MTKIAQKVKNDKTPGFEEALARLEEIVRALEGGDLTLDESLTLFEEGMGLLRICARRLDEAEMKISLLMKGKDGEPIEVPFKAEGDAS